MSHANPAQNKRLGQPASADIRVCPAHSRLRWSRRGARLRVAGAWSRARQSRFIAALLNSKGLDEACAQVNVTLAQALAERLRDKAFRTEWLAADAERLETAETRYIDHLLGALASKDKERLAALQDKVALTVWQTLRDGRKRPGVAAAQPPADAGPVTVPGPDGQAKPEGYDEAEIAALIAKVEAGIVAAEAELGLR